jgi:hypothetical protein
MPRGELVVDGRGGRVGSTINIGITDYLAGAGLGGEVGVGMRRRCEEEEGIDCPELPQSDDA